MLSVWTSLKFCRLVKSKFVVCKSFQYGQAYNVVVWLKKLNQVSVRSKLYAPMI